MGFKTFIAEAPGDDTVADTRATVAAMITSNLFRFINNSNQNDTRSILLLIAALQLLNTNDSTQSISAAKRLAQSALARAGKKPMKGI